MRDFLGNELKLGDSVIYTMTQSQGRSAALQIGTIKSFYKGRYNADECTVDDKVHIQSFRIYLIK